ncbi:hypothetical protein EYZ11_002227 [Aspergillus tanneri]|uniref:Uncharacterized protein n=1 Tax=Aspergillus tanneri TaxID=1220188 RepID=A0A4V3UQB3_9EURO|nr:hypothetical protein EYZ11_002227 [Aspergillus tanneri]
MHRHANLKQTGAERLFLGPLKKKNAVEEHVWHEAEKMRFPDKSGDTRDHLNQRAASPKRHFNRTRYDSPAMPRFQVKYTNVGRFTDPVLWVTKSFGSASGDGTALRRCAA